MIDFESVKRNLKAISIDSSYTYVHDFCSEAIEIIDSLNSEKIAAESERDELKAKLADMEKQEPVATVEQMNQERYFSCLATSYVSKPKFGDKLYAQPKPAQRITEQDAREIVKNYIKYNWSNYIKLTDEALDVWISQYGRTLLAKLNEYREPVTANKAEAPVAWRRYVGIIGGSPCFSYREQQPLGDVFEWKKLFYSSSEHRQWLPIETAPKDGSYVDLLINGDRETNCKFLNGEWVDWDKRENKYCWSGDPSHWMPIPLQPLKDGE